MNGVPKTPSESTSKKNEDWKEAFAYTSNDSESLNNKKKKLLKERRNINEQLSKIRKQLEIIDSSTNSVHNSNYLNDLTAKQWM